MEYAKIYTQLYRKASGTNFHGGELCFSTEKSIELSSHGDFCLVLDAKEYEGLYEDGDIDAGRNFGYDEFRVNMSMDELIENIDCIVVPNSWFESEMDVDSPDYVQENDPMEWIENLQNYGRVIPESEYSGEKINFNF